MDSFTGKYYLEDGEKQEASILFLKDKLSIGLKDEYGNPRIVYWPYDGIIRTQFWKGKMAVARFNEYPIQTLEVSSRSFAERLEGIFHQKEKTWFRRTFTKRRMHMIKVLSIFFAGLLAAYFVLIPFLAERLAKKVPVSYEENLGNKIYDVLSSDFEVDELKTIYINNFFREMQTQTEYSIRITVVKEPIANAFALPGGNIVVYDRIFSGLNNYEDLAALLAHEFSHVQNKHTTRSLFRQMGSGIFISVFLGDVGTIGNTIISNAGNLKNLSYSRKLEKEADIQGLKILAERKIDCNGFVRLFEFLKNESLSAERQPAEWISSHPDLEKRIEYLQNDEWFNKNGTQENETLKTLFMKIKTSD